MADFDEEELKRTYEEIKPTIESRLKEFEETWKCREEKEIFNELTFCLFTPQSKAEYCWETVKELRAENLISEGEEDEISERLNRVRFKNNKAGYLVEARERFLESDVSLRDKIKNFSDSKEAREWIVDNIKGLGYKEASHFLRNIGKGDDLAILDRHILKNLEKLDIIEQKPKTLTPKRYLDIEKKMRDFAQDIDIPLGHLDLVLWYRETGRVFK